MFKSMDLIRFKSKKLARLAIIAFLAALFLRIFAVQAFKIPTESMENTLLAGDFILVNKLIYGARTPDSLPLLDVTLPTITLPAFGDPKPGDVIVFRSPKNPSTEFVKRCVAVSGQTVEIVDKDVFVDGEKFDDKFDVTTAKFEDPYIIPKSDRDINIFPNQSMGNKDNYGPIVVPSDAFFVMGDNRDNSSDSRFWGFVPRDHLVGKAFVVYWSVDPGSLIMPRWSRIGSVIH